MTIFNTKPDRKKARLILKNVTTTLEMIALLDASHFSSNIAKEYYDVIRELMTIVLLMDGYRTYGDGAHKELIEYIYSHYVFTPHEQHLVYQLLNLRNKISYEGFFVKEEYIKRNKAKIETIIKKLQDIVEEKIR